MDTDLRIIPGDLHCDLYTMRCTIVSASVPCPIFLLPFFFLTSPTILPYHNSSSATRHYFTPKDQAMHLSSSKTELLVRLLMNRLVSHRILTMSPHYNYSQVRHRTNSLAIALSAKWNIGVSFLTMTRGELN